MTPSEIAEELRILFAKRPQVIKPGLERIKAALPYLGGIEKRVPTVIVAGTNGKGTTAGYLWQLLTATGFKAGLFTSPHLINFSERFCVSGHELSDEELITGLQHLRSKIPPAVYTELSFFEVNTLLALQVFTEKNTEINVLEVGMGGRWDSTNVCDADLAVITSIGMDHMEFLGDSLAKIAAEKAGIMRYGRTCLWSGTAGTPADQVIKQHAIATCSWLYTLDLDYGLKSSRKFFFRKSRDSRQLALPPHFVALPKYLRQNFVTALAAYCFVVVERIVTRPDADRLNRIALIAERVLEGSLAQPPSLLGRFQLLVRSKPIGSVSHLLLDACHNPDGAAVFAEALQEKYDSGTYKSKLPAVVSVLRDKKHADILDVLRTVCSPVVLFANQSERSWQQCDVAEHHRDLVFAADFEQAVAEVERAGASNGPESPLVVCGSVHLMGQVLSS